MSIYLRLFLWFCAANLLTLGASILIAHAIFERSADRPPNIDRLAMEVETALRAGTTLPPDQPRDGRRWFVLRDGRALDGKPLPPPVARNLAELDSERAELRLPRGTWLVSRRIAAPEGAALLVVMEGRGQRKSQARWLTLALQVALSLLAIAGVGWVVARHLSRPLQRIQSVVRSVAAGDLSSRVGGAVAMRKDEYGRLARDFDRMAAQIESLVSTRDQLLHDVSHELRAPLSRLRFALELAREDGGQSLERADREIARIDALVGELLALARLDSANRDWPQLDLEELAQDVMEAERPEAAHRGVSLEFTGRPVRAAGEREALTRALENLVRNAIRHSPPGAAVSVELREQQDEAVLSVRDRGPGVAPEELSRLFEPFFRGRTAGPEGYGLGLAIVARVMRAHRGRAEARNREDGGLEVILYLPLRPAASE